MAIRPPSDIVLDVARAADPMRYSQAKTKLQEMAGSVGSAEFDAVFDQVVKRPGAGRSSFGTATAMMNFRNTAALSPPRTFGQAACAGQVDPRKAEAYQAFEAMALRNVVETLLPKESEAVYGQGFAGSIWKSMLAEQVANQMARSGGIGIAERLMAADPSARSGDVPRDVDDLADKIVKAGATDRGATAPAAVGAGSAAMPPIETLLPVETLPPAEALPALGDPDSDTLL